MIILLIIIGTYAISCHFSPSMTIYCDQSSYVAMKNAIAMGGFELLFEIFGLARVYGKIIKKDK